MSLEIETNTEDFDDILQEANIKLDGCKFAYVFSLLTKTPGKKGELPPEVAAFKEFLDLTAREQGICSEETKKSPLVHAWHNNNRLYFVIDLADTILESLVGGTLRDAFEVYRQYSIDIKVRIATAMTLKSIVETVGPAH